MNVRKGNYEKVAKFLRDYSRRYGRAVDLLTIVRKTRVPKSSAARYLKKMEEEGSVRHMGRSGYITTAQLQILDDMKAVPFCGPVSCGIPRDTALDTAEYTYYSLPRDLTGAGSFFLLEAEGDSMIEDGICEGDLILVRAQPEPDRDMQIVVAMVGGETLLKHIHIDTEKGFTELIPANSGMRSVRYVHGVDEDVEVQGVAVMKLSYL